MNPLLAALLLSAGYNTALVSIGAALLGASAAIVGTYVLLRKRSLVSDAISHATLPGLALSFIGAAWLTGVGRSTIALMGGAAMSAGLGLLAVEWMARRTRLAKEPRRGLGIAHGSWQEKLECNLAMKREVLSEVDRAHASRTEVPGDAVVRDRCADHL